MNLKARKLWTSIGLLILCLSASAGTSKQNDESLLKPRIVVLTDIAPADVEPDDMESMVRLLAHADMFEIEGLVATGGWNICGGTYPESWMDSLLTVIDAYEKDLPNLMKRSEQEGFLPERQENGKQELGYWPTAGYLRSRTVLGSRGLGIERIGEGNDSPGSDLIIKLVDEEDSRPLWITVWGGANTLAQAVWRVRKERSESEVHKFLDKLCVYTITDQDVCGGSPVDYAFSSHQWLRKTCGKELRFFWDESAWLVQNTLGSMNWNEYATHIQGHGHLGKVYPKNKYGVEGDTPSYLHVFPNGLNNPAVGNQVGWGGYFRWALSPDSLTECYTNAAPDVKAVSEKYEKYFYPAIFADFAARMDWAACGEGNHNPSVYVNGKKGLDPIIITSKVGRRIWLDASESIDVDNDSLAYHWWILPEAGTYTGHIEIMQTDKPVAFFDIPQDAAGKELHMICEVMDNGSPALTGYRRVIIRPVD